MKLLYITNGINGAGGLERVLSIKASYLAENYGYEVTILCLNDSHVEPFYEFSDKIRMTSIPVMGNPLQYINTYKKGVKEIVEQIGPDIISVCDDGLKGFFIPKILGNEIPIIYERHSSVNLNFKRKNNSSVLVIKNKLQYTLMKSLGSKFDKFVVLTRGNLKEWKGDNLEVIPNPLSFYPKESALLEQKTVIAVGSHGYNKGYDLLISAWEKVVEKYKDWNLEIYGKIDQDKTYINQAEKLGLKDQIYFFEPVKDIQEKYLNSSVMVLPSRSEGFGMVLIEAMACGVPCVSFDCPNGPADIIQNNKDGFLVENGNVQKLAQKLMILIEDEALRIEMGKRAKENVKRYLPETIVKEWDVLFKSLIKE